MYRSSSFSKIILPYSSIPARTFKLQASRSTVASPTCFSTSNGYLWSFKTAGNSDHRVVLSNFAGRRRQSLEWGGMYEVRSHCPPVSSQFVRHEQKAGQVYIGVPDCRVEIRSRATERSLRIFVSISFVSKLGGIGHATATQRGCEHSYCTLVKSDLPSAGALPPWIC